MAHLKRIFVIVYIVGVVVALTQAVRGLLGDADAVAALGLLLATAPMFGFLAVAMATRRVARTTQRMPAIALLALLGAIASVWAVVARGAEAGWAVAALAAFVGYLVYAYWYSSFGRRPSPAIRPGGTMPEITLQRADGELKTTADLTGGKAVFVFIRGNWCPFCMAQVNELAATAADFEAAGVAVHIVASQSPGKTRALAKDRPAALGFYSDPDNEAARTLGIANPAGLPFGMEILGYRSDTALPTVIVTAPGGLILWTHETDNYRMRPTAAELLRRAAEA